MGLKSTLLFMPAASAFGILRVAANVADVETFTIGAEVYEFDRAADGVVAGRIAVVGHVDDTPANATAAMVVAINGNATGAYGAAKVDANTVLVVPRVGGASSVGSTETMGGGGNAWDAVTLGGGAAATQKQFRMGTRVPSAAEVTAGVLVIPTIFTPVTAQIRILVTGTGVEKVWDGATTFVAASGNTPGYVHIDNTGATDWAATDTVHYFTTD